MKSIVEIVESRERAWQVSELATLLDCTSEYLYKLIKQNRLPAYRIGSLVRLDPKTTAEWLRTKMVGKVR